MMKMNKFFGLLCVVVMLFVPFTFAGCNNSATYEYSDLQELYNDIVHSNSDIFENDGTIRIVYDNPILNNLIQENNAQNQFNKLSGDSANSYAIFEPTFRASMMVVNEFIKKPYIDQTNFDKKHSTSLYNKLLELKASIKQFKETKLHLEDREKIDVNTATVKSWRNDLFLDYYNMIDISCDFALDFANFYENNVLGQKKVGERYVANYMKLDYLRMVAECARIDTDTMICANYNRVVTSLDTSASVKMMNLYLSIPTTELWTNSEGSILTQAEKNVMEAFDLWQNYELVFYQAKTMLYNALSMDNYNQVVYQNSQNSNELSAEQKNIIAQVDRFTSCESANMYAYINSFTTKLKSFMNE